MGADSNSSQDEDEMTPLYVAILYGRTHVVDVLLEYGADPNRPAYGTKYNPLKIAANCPDFKILELLVKNGATIPVETDDDGEKDVGGRLFYGPAVAGSLECVETLLEYGARPHAGNVAVAAQWGHDDLARRLACEITGSPLIVAVCLGEEDKVVQHLDQLDVSVMDVPTRESLLYAALAAGRSAIAKLLFDRGADFKSVIQEPMLHASLAACAKTDVIGLALEHGLDINSCDGNGNTMLHMAAFKCNIQAVRYLLSFGANPALQNKEGKRPFDMGCGFPIWEANKKPIRRLLRIAMIKKWLHLI
jgi:ankyrin repeat protein